MERSREILKELQDDIDESKSKLPVIVQSVEKKVEIYKKLKTELTDLEALGRYELEIRLNKAKLLWLDVQSIETSVEELDQDVVAKREQLNTATAALEEAENAMTAADNINSIKEQMEVLAADQQGVIADLEQKNHNVNNKQKERDQIMVKLKVASSKRADFVERIDVANAGVRIID